MHDTTAHVWYRLPSLVEKYQIIKTITTSLWCNSSRLHPVEHKLESVNNLVSTVLNSEPSVKYTHSIYGVGTFPTSTTCTYSNIRILGTSRVFTQDQISQRRIQCMCTVYIYGPFIWAKPVNLITFIISQTLYAYTYVNSTFYV